MFENITNALNQSTEKLNWNEYIIFNKRLEQNVINLINFKSTRSLWIANDLALVTFIELLPKSKNLNDYEKIQSLYSEALPLANRVGMATILNPADPIYYGLFTGKCKEQWIASIDNKSQYSKDKPIRCLYHPFTSLNFWMEEDVENVSDQIAFFSVDIIALSQLINSIYKQNDEFDVKKFITRNIIPSIISDLVNITLFNRYNSLVNKTIIEDGNSRLIPIWFDLIDTCDINQKNVLDTISRTSGSIEFISQNLPLYAKDTLSTFINSFPQFSSVKNIFPLIFTVMSIYLNFLLGFNASFKGIKNQTFLNSIRLQLAILKNDKTLLSDDRLLRSEQEKLFAILQTFL